MPRRHRLIQGKSRHFAGYRRGLYDPRDFRFRDHRERLDDGTLAAVLRGELPVSASTRSLYQPPVRDQGALGSCVANAGCTAAGYLFHRLAKKPDPLFSRLALYAFVRRLEGTPLTEDSGAYVRDAFKAMAKSGVCFERTWPYIVQRFSRAPTPIAVREAAKHRALVYLRCTSPMDIKVSIASGHPVIGGFTCFESLERATVSRSGDVPFPADDESVIGGHCVYFDSYDDKAGMLGFQNSWGTGWGAKGFGRLPYAYVEQGLADDFWTIRKEIV